LPKTGEIVIFFIGMEGNNMSDSQQNDNTQVNFSALILGFSSAALHYLGEAAPEGDGSITKNINLAKQNIDIVSLLKEKTEGNLSEDESRLISQVLADLQNKYLEASK
jgi:hypothetical protein